MPTKEKKYLVVLLASKLPFLIYLIPTVSRRKIFTKEKKRLTQHRVL